MASIAYITDYKLLEYHRLNQSKEMNFWRLNPNMNFSNFKKGDLLFFLSKDKNSKRRNEKGIMGYGRCKSFSSASVNTMWKNYGAKNGYTSLKNFREAILKVTKDNKLPSKIGSIYLEDLVFFGTPIYLSDCGKEISKSVESYTYLDEENEIVTINVLESAKEVLDLWTRVDDDVSFIEKEEIRCVLYNVHKKISFKYPSRLSNKTMQEFLKTNSDYEYIQDSKVAAYKIEEDNLYIVLAPLHMKDDMMAKRILLGQETLYKKMIEEIYPYNLNIIFKVIEK